MRARNALVLTMLGGLALGQPAFARHPPDTFRAPPTGELMQREPLIDQQRDPLLDSRARLSPADAARDAQRRYGGRVLNVSPTSGGYRVKLLNGGDVRVVIVPDR